MTISSTAPRIQYTATSGQTVFPYPFKIWADADLVVYQTPNGSNPDDTSDLLTLTTHYTVSGAGSASGGNVTLVTGATAGDTITILRDITQERTADYQTGGDLLASTLNEEQDKQLGMVQELAGSLSRMLRLADSDTDTIATLPTSRANKALVFDANGDPAASTDDYEDQLANVTAQATAAAASASAASDSETAAAASESAAATSEINAAASEAAAAASYDAFDDRFLGAKASAPTTDNDGDPLTAGVLYYNTTDGDMYVHTGSAWVTVSNAASAAAAAASESAAAASAGAASTSEANAAASASAASTSEGNAASSASAASTSEGNAAASEAACAAYESSIVAEGAAQVAAVQAEGATQISAVNAAGASWSGVADLEVGDLAAPLVRLPLKNSLAGDYAGTLTFTNASTTRTYIDRYGVLQYAAANEPRFEKEGLLYEDESTNLLTYSEEFDNAAWTKTRASVVANAAIAPDGMTTADKIVEDTTATSSHSVMQISTASAGALCASVFLMAGERTKAQINVYNPTDGVIAFVRLDLITGEVDSSLGSLVTTLRDDGWWRISVSAEATVASTRLYVYTIADNWSFNYTGDGSSGIYSWGAHLEPGSKPSSYIPSTDAPITRLADSLTLTYAENFPGPGDALTVLADVVLPGLSTGSDHYVLSIAGATTRALYSAASADELIAADGSSGTDAVALSSTTVRAGMVHNGSTVEAFADGTGSGTPVTPGGVATGTPTAINIGMDGSGGNYLNGHIANLRIYDFALNDNQMRIA